MNGKSPPYIECGLHVLGQPDQGVLLRLLALDLPHQPLQETHVVLRTH